MSAISTLLSKIQTDRKQTQLTSANIARANVEGYTRKVAHEEKIVINNAVTGVKQSQVERVIDPVLQKEVRTQNSKLGKSAWLQEYYTNISQLLGSKGEQSSFVHNLNNFAAQMTQVASITDGNKKREAVQQAVTLCGQLNNISDHINQLRGQTDQELANAIDQLNSMMTSMEDFNRQIVSLSINNQDAKNLEDERDLIIHNAAELCGIKIYDGQFKNKTLALESGDMLATSTATFSLNYTAATYVAPGDGLSNITNAFGTNITDTFTNGRISGLLELRNKILPNIQAELDELTRVVRDTTNALHNEAAALGGDSTLMGLRYAPGVPAAVLLSGTTDISGQGTVRIGVTDRDGTLLDYKDVPLTDGMTVGGLVATINSTPYVIGDATGAFTVTQLPTGELQIISTANKSVAIGAAGTLKPTLSATTTYNDTQAYGLSHFFGLNNLFDTGNKVASPTAQIGIANSISVRPSIYANISNLSVGRLSHLTPPPTGKGLGLRANDATVALEIGDTLARGTLNFLTVGALKASNISTTEYATRIMSLVQAEIAQSKSTQQITQRVYDELTTLTQQKSGVEPAEEIMRVFELTNSINLASKSLNIVTAMEKDLIQTLAR
jgi:flagellar hook-associated protein 1 FlgK